MRALPLASFNIFNEISDFLLFQMRTAQTPLMFLLSVLTFQSCAILHAEDSEIPKDFLKEYSLVEGSVKRVVADNNAKEAIDRLIKVEVEISDVILGPDSLMHRKAYFESMPLEACIPGSPLEGKSMHYPLMKVGEKLLLKVHSKKTSKPTGDSLLKGFPGDDAGVEEDEEIAISARTGKSKGGFLFDNFMQWTYQESITHAVYLKGLNHLAPKQFTDAVYKGYSRLLRLLPQHLAI